MGRACLSVPPRSTRCLRALRCSLSRVTCDRSLPLSFFLIPCPMTPQRAPSIRGVLVVLLLFCFLNVQALKSQLLSRLSAANAPVANGVSYVTKYFDQKIDHFGFLEDGTFKQRYLVNDDHWHQIGGPILFYTGNEGDITWFCNNTGFMWDVAEELGAMLVFAEHRYYGESLPFGKESYSSLKHLNYLTSEQALADFAVLILHLKATVPGATKSPVVAIGGSYGGMLSAWMRMKYPHLVVGALAASAPIWQFTNMTSCGVFYKIVTNDFTRHGLDCSVSIRKSWSSVDNVSSTDDGLTWLSNEFSMCSPLKKQDMQMFKAWLQETWVNLAMVNYPYEANFLQPLPRWPIQVVCTHLRNASLPDRLLLQAISHAVRVYYNYTGEAACLDISQTATGNLGYLGWYYQACTEMVMPMCTDGVQDMFEPQPWDFQAFSEECYKQFGVRPRIDWAITMYGGKQIHSHSNIIFSNGKLDPWSGGGVMESLTSSLVAIVIPDGAHHLDLRYNTNYDPSSVLHARALEVKYIQQWIKEAAEMT
uniref:Lysosomal Pro-X carboxypeptidase n=1 Tax=Paramormyrops kingsleyae TaxID=1676925 RepID=A0A3B3QIV4_9TELE|nr:lysosomal Pro-X carboxypeptidase [Paramormyrops kingsleyae]